MRMRTTVRMNEELLRRAKKHAAGQGRTLTSLMEEGLALVLTRTKVDMPEHVDLPISRASGGLHPGVDLNRSSELAAVLEDR